MIEFGLRFARGLKQTLERENRVLLDCELIIELDTSRAKLGDGVRAYVDLPYLDDGLEIDDGETPKRPEGAVNHLDMVFLQTSQEIINLTGNNQGMSKALAWHRPAMTHQSLFVKGWNNPEENQDLAVIHRRLYPARVSGQYCLFTSVNGELNLLGENNWIWQ